MARNKLIARTILFPLSILYGIGVRTRNLMFKWGLLKRRTFKVPVIVVGNISVGGTGKTPHTEYIISMLKLTRHVGVLSRGYGRKTKGFIQVTKNSTPRDVGDEPYQMFRKYGDGTMFAVCENRVKGIEEMLRLDPDIDVIVLDDAYQHRYVKPSISVVLTEFNRPFFLDHLLPYGRLREPAGAIDNADIVIVTKCPEHIKPLEQRIFKTNLKLYPYQHLFFSRFIYRQPIPLFPDDTNYNPTLEYLSADDSILSVSGIANPRPFVTYLRSFKPKVRVKLFPDHHDFTKKDLKLIEDKFDAMPGTNRLIITTEKDAVRLINNPYFPPRLRKYIYYLPIAVKVEPRDGSTFDELILKNVPRRKTKNV